MNIITVSIVFRLIKGYALIISLLLEKWLTGIFGGKNLYEKHLRFLVNKTKLFDTAYYLEMKPSLAEQGKSAIADYVANGDRKGRWPMPFFDPQYYRSQIKSNLKTVNALLHYAYIGRYLRLSPSPWFDVNYYLKENKDVLRAEIDPILHYLKWGGLEGRSPTVQFDGSYYLRKNADVREARVNPLLHYLRIGRFEGRPTAFNQQLNGESYQAYTYKNAPRNRQYDQQKILPKRQGVSDAKIDVIVPVYKDQELTLRTLYSILMAEVDVSFELIVINDCTPEPGLLVALEKLKNEKLITLVHNVENRGFVHTANRGMQIHSNRDVVLLNADTEVFSHWLDKLHTAAYRHLRTGTVTPLSNNATICSYPCFLHDNPYPLELSYEELNNIAAEVNSGVDIKAPTGVAFCLYIRRDCISSVGLFNENSFGWGYGEENDFCQRAISKGWQNILTADTFVRHWGSTSFKREKAERVNAALKVVNHLHPSYLLQVDDFIRQDPLAAARERLDWARLLKQVKQQNVLIVCHHRGGGSERHVHEDTARLLQEGAGVFYLKPVPGKPKYVRLAHPKCSQLLNLKSYFFADIKHLASALTELGITRIHVHGLVDYTINAPDYILQLVDVLQTELWLDLHDYEMICPRINLTNRAGRYCGEPNEMFCNLCCESERNDFGATNIEFWRRSHHRLLQRADKVWVPNIDIKLRLLRYFDDISFSLSPHEEIEINKITITTPQLSSDSTLRIVVIGSIGKAKGFDILNACAKDAKKRKLPLEFALLGYSLKDNELERSHVKITGRYLEHEAQAKLKELSPHIVWLPSTWPETYSYTLSLAISGGYPTFAFDIGAIAVRLREIGQEDTLMPLQLLESPHIINDRFVSYLKYCQKL